MNIDESILFLEYIYYDFKFLNYMVLNICYIGDMRF